MQVGLRCTAIISLVGVLFLLVTLQTTSAASSPDYDVGGLRELYQMLRESQQEAPWMDSHRLVRKNNRSPQLRLRFGKRDPFSYQILHGLENAMPDSTEN